MNKIHKSTRSACLQLGQNHQLMHNHAVPHQVQQPDGGALQLVLCDDALADAVHQAQVPVYGVYAPAADLPADGRIMDGCCITTVASAAAAADPPAQSTTQSITEEASPPNAQAANGVLCHRPCPAAATTATATAAAAATWMMVLIQAGSDLHQA